jgi:hypothetical protein
MARARSQQERRAASARPIKDREPVDPDTIEPFPDGFLVVEEWDEDFEAWQREQEAG